MRRVWVGLALACALLPFMVSVAAAQEPKVLIYSGTTATATPAPARRSSPRWSS